MEELGGYGSGAAAAAGSYGDPGRGGGGVRGEGRQQRSSAASAAGGGSKVQGWSSLTRLHRNLATSSSPRRDPFPPLATSNSLSSKRSKNSRQILLPPPVLGENFNQLQQASAAGPIVSSGSSWSSNLQGGAASVQNGAAYSSNGREGTGRGDGIVGDTDERRRRRVGSDSSSSSTDSFASNSFGAIVGAAAAGSTTGNYYQLGRSGRSPPVSSAASYNHWVEGGLDPLVSVFPSSSGNAVSGREPGKASKHERNLELSADAEPFFPLEKRGSCVQNPYKLEAEAELSFLRDESHGLDPNAEGHRQDDLGERIENRDSVAAVSEHREPERSSVSDCRSSIGDVERDANSEAGAHACDLGRDGGDSTAASSAFYVPMEPEWEEDDIYLRYRSNALRTVRERNRFSRGASQAYMRGDHRRAKVMSKQALEKRLLAEKLNAEAANEILNQRNKISSVDIWHMDLHGLHAGEAVAALENRLMYIETEVHPSILTDMREGSNVAQEVAETSNLRAHQDALKQKHTQSLITTPRELLVITGVGVHSQGGPTLPFSVKNFLLNKGYQFVQNTPGSFLVRPRLRLSVDMINWGSAGATDRRVVSTGHLDASLSVKSQ